jgi:hypothetical protein
MPVTLAKAPKHIYQCEGEYGPLGDYQDAGVHVPEDRITYWVCPDHEPYDTTGASIHLDYPEDILFGGY